MEAVEAPGVGHEPGALGLEHGPDRLVRDLGVSMSLGIGDALVEEPGVELVVALEPEAWRDESARAPARPGSRPAPSPSRPMACRRSAPPDSGRTSAGSGGYRPVPCRRRRS